MAITKTWTKYSTIKPSDIAERNDCAVRALAIAMGITYGEAHDAHAKRGRQFGKGTRWSCSILVARDMGLVQLPISPCARPTLAQFVRVNRKGRFWVCRSGHAFAIVDGVVHDWETGTGPRSRIQLAFQVR